MIEKGVDQKKFYTSNEFQQLKPYLSDDEASAITPKVSSDGTLVAVISTGGIHAGVNVYSHVLIRVLARLERKWGLL